MTSRLHNLLALQDVDLALDQIRHRRTHLPEREELSRLAVTAAATDADRAAVASERAELVERQRAAESELAGTESRISAIDRRLYGGEVSAAKDLQAMVAEIDQLKARASMLEDVVLEVLEATEPLDARVAELDSSLAELDRRRAETEASLAAVESALDKERAALDDQRAAAAAAIAEVLLPVYERLRSRLGGVGVARVVGNHCDGCHLTLSAAELDHVRHLPEGEIYTCEQCSRILVP